MKAALQHNNIQMIHTITIYLACKRLVYATSPHSLATADLHWTQMRLYKQCQLCCTKDEDNEDISVARPSIWNSVIEPLRTINWTAISKHTTPCLGICTTRSCGGGAEPIKDRKREEDCCTFVNKIIAVGAQSTLGGGKKFLPEKYVRKLTKYPNFTWFLPENYQKYPNFYDICPKN